MGKIRGEPAQLAYRARDGTCSTKGVSAGRVGVTTASGRAQAVEYGIGRVVAQPYGEVLAKVRDALKSEGFGVITEIDVQATMKEKLGLDGAPSVILGACNPPLAHRALTTEPDIGLLLPCNVVVYEVPEGTRVAAIKAAAVFAMVGSPALAEIADEVGARLQRVIDDL
jgi:uncharacterized protein (DUF302 family)